MVRGLAMVPLLCGCGGATLILEGPIQDQCKDAGLMGCKAITAGVLKVVEGDKAAGLKKIAAGASENSPESLRTFAVGLRALGDLPGASQFMAPILEVANKLDPGGGSEVAASDAESSGGADPEDEERHRGRLVAAAASLAPRTLLPADADPDQLRSGQSSPSTDRKAEACGSTDGTCSRVVYGPFVLTDAVPVVDGCEGLFVASVSLVDERAPTWMLPLRERIHGARLSVPQGDALVVGDTGEVPCSVVWSGYKLRHGDED